MTVLIYMYLSPKYINLIQTACATGLAILKPMDIRHCMLPWWVTTDNGSKSRFVVNAWMTLQNKDLPPIGNTKKEAVVKTRENLRSGWKPSKKFWMILNRMLLTSWIQSNSTCLPPKYLCSHQKVNSKPCLRIPQHWILLSHYIQTSAVTVSVQK